MNAESAKHLLEIKDLEIAFNMQRGRVEAVRGVSLCVDEGEILSIVGQSGSGKTAMCRTILRLHAGNAETSGEILLGGRDLLNMSDEEMESVRGRDISMILQNPATALDPTYSVGRQITESILVHEKISKADAKERAIELLNLVGIDQAEARFNQHPHMFSGGMKQRVAIAIALASKPRLLIADEPTTALDRDVQWQIIDCLRDVQRELKTAVIFITHDLGLVESLPGRTAVMKGGKIVESGRTEDVLAHPRHEYTKELLGYADYGKGRGHTHGDIHFHGGVAHTHSPAQRSDLIRIEGLSKSYELIRGRTHRVFQDLDMEIKDGEILGIVGPSGSGKSTLARCIMGIEKPTKGTVREMRPVKKHMIFQDSLEALNAHMRLRDIIAEPIVISGKQSAEEFPVGLSEEGLNETTDASEERSAREERGKARGSKRKGVIDKCVLEAARAVELDEELLERFPYDVSGGQRQRAAIARALAAGADFIIADEPISSLDIATQSQIVHLIRRLADERGLTIMLIAHDLPMVRHVSDRIIEISRI